MIWAALGIAALVVLAIIVRRGIAPATRWEDFNP